MTWFSKSKLRSPSVSEISTSLLYNEITFYDRFIQDLVSANNEIIIESPFITSQRLKILKPHFEKLISRGVKVFIITRYPKEHEKIMAEQVESKIQILSR